MPVKDPCKPFACKIQDCLKANRYQQEKCDYAIEEMKKCCQVWKDKSFVCHGMDYEGKPSSS